MFWLRPIFFSMPLFIPLAGWWLFEKVGELRLSRESGAFVCAIREPVGYLNPLVPSAGISGEITNLLFDPLFIRDDKLELQPNLIEKWSAQTVVTIRCSSEEAAGESEAMLRSGEYLDEGMKMLAIDRTDSVLTVALDGLEEKLDEKLLSRFAPENLGDYLLVNLTLKHSVRESFESFLESSVEKTQVRMIEYNGDREAKFFVQGETEIFLRELRLYYESNESLEPKIELKGERCHTTAQELILDLREGVKWHDGQPFTAEDVVFSYRELTRPDSPLPLADSFWFVERVESLNAQRIRVECREAPGTMLESWENLPVFPSHLLSLLSDPTEMSAFFLNPVGTGPYRMAARRGDGGVELVANEDYFGPVPLEKRIRYRRFGSLEATLLALRSNSLDVLEPEERFEDWSRRNPGTVEAIPAVARFQYLVAWNLSRPPFDRNPVRTALAKAIEVKEVLEDSATRFEEPVTGLFYPGSAVVDEAIMLPLHDPRGAEVLLEREGYKRDAKSGFWRGTDGSPFGFKLSVNRANPEHRRIATALVEQWVALGIAVKVELMDWPDLLERRLLNREFEAVLLSWEIPTSRDRFAVWHSSESKPGGGNFFGLRNPQVDEILTKIRYETDLMKIQTETARLQKAISDLQPCLFVGGSGRLFNVRSDALFIKRRDSGSPAIPLAQAVERGNLEAERPWWVRKETLDQIEEEAPIKE